MRLTRVRLLIGLFFALSAALSGCPGNNGVAETSGSAPLQTMARQAPAEKVITRDVIKWTGKPAESWKNYNKLINEQKFEQASKLVEDMLEGAKSKKNSEEWVRSLIRYVQLRSALHGYETSVRFLKEQPWPEDLLGHSVLNLFYARSLVSYSRTYSWEIRKRERVESKGKVDLKAWTMDQIYEEAQKAYAQVYAARKQLGEFPSKHLSEYVEENNYPREIRKTLRDTVVYLWVQLLADNSGWRPEHSNEIYQLNLGELIGGESPYPQVALTDPALHPLKKIASILDDLERWHLDRDKPESAFEARLTRLTRLHASFTQEKDRARIRKHLADALPSMQKHRWWAQGMATLAEFTRTESAPDNLIRAHEIAGRGHQAYPDSMGGARCLHIQKAIEAPDYRLVAMATDGPSKQSMSVNHKNLEKLYLRAYPLDLKAQIKTADDYNLFPNYRQLESILKKRKPALQWTVDLPRTPDYKMHKRYFQPPMKKPGYYIILASARPEFPKSDNRIQAVNMIIGDLVLITRQQPGLLNVDVRSGESGRPIKGVKVTLYRYDWKNKHQQVEVRSTGKDGTVQFKRSGSYSHFVFARKGKQIGIDPNYLYLYAKHKPRVVTNTLIYTDRSIYRPLQTLHFKAVVYRGQRDKADFKTLPNSSVTITLMDPNYQKVATKKVKTNSFGTASGEFVIPSGRLLGRWQLRSSLNGNAWVQVEEYKRPTFQAKFLDPEKPLRLNKPATLKGEARYYFGLPVTSARIKWRVTRAPVYPWWWSYWWRPHRASSGTQTIAAGITALKDDGTFELTFTPEADEQLGEESQGMSYRYSVNADVTDEGGETRSASRTFRLGFVAVEARLQLDSDFLVANRKSELMVVRTDLDGSPAPGKGDYRIVSVIGPDQALLPVDQPLLKPPKKSPDKDYSHPGDRQRSRWEPGYNVNAVLRGWKDGAQQTSGKLTHDDKGEAKFSLPALAAGVYRLHYTTKDAFGAEYQMSKEFVVAGKRSNIPLPAMFMVENSSVPVGKTARILVVSGLKNQPIIFDIYRSGEHVERRSYESFKDLNLIEIPITEKDRGGFAVSMGVLRDHQWMHFQRSVFVPWDNKELKVEFSTFRDKLRPGTKETWSVKVTGPAGKKTAVKTAELLAYMYDKSLDAFTPHHPPSPISLFPNRASGVWPRAGLGRARESWVDSRGFTPPPSYPHLRAAALKFFDEYGIGGPGRRGYRKYSRRAREAPRPAAPMATRVQADAPMGESASEVAQPEAKQAPAKKAAKSKDKAGRLDRTLEADEDGVADGGDQADIELRTDFSETAFFQPHLITGKDGSARIEFTVPDSVTAWNVWVHAITRDLKSGSKHIEAQSVKDLMVRPYLPRFLREGDQAALKVVVNNASEKELKGKLTFDIIDPVTEKSILKTFGLKPKDAKNQPFTVEAKGGTNLSFPIKTPAKVGLIAFKVVATAGDHSDGELRPIPVLPGRMHLAQSRFVTLKDKTRREMHFADMKKDDDPSLIHEQMVVTIDAQLFYSVLSALPYLVNYPYECTEQILNRFLSTGILSSMYKDYPAIKRMAKKFAERETQYERWDVNDPNRKMALEETPWLQMAQGGPERSHPLLNVLDPRIAEAQRKSSLAKLKKAQTSAGAFPWFPGGPPSPYITLYLLYGFSKALEFDVEVPKNMVHRAWRYMHRHYINEVIHRMIALDCCWEFITFLNYVLSNYPDPSWYQGTFTPEERTKMLNFSFKHWKEHSPYVKGYLALTLHRSDRKKDAMLVWESVMDSAKTKEDQGTFWAPEDRGWLWYNDTIETHAFAIRTVMEVTPKEPKLDGLVLWIFLNKKLNHWKSTRATAEVIYSLAHFLKKTQQLGLREEIKVSAGKLNKNFVFEPDEYTGKKNQIVIPGEQIDPKSTSTVVVEKETKGYAFASATWHFSTEKLPEEARGDYLAVTRKYFKRVKTGREVVLKPLKEGAGLEPGDEIEVHISLTAKHPMEYVHLRDPRAAGCEPISTVSKHKWELGLYWYEEVRDSGTNFFFERLPQGEYTFKYRLRAAIAGKFKVSPATVQPMYAPEFTGYSSGARMEIRPAD